MDWILAMSGTEWTEPGQGAAADQLFYAVGALFGKKRPTSEQAKAFHHVGEFGGLSAVTRTNLRLTGAPLTAEDVERIGRAR